MSEAMFGSLRVVLGAKKSILSLLESFLGPSCLRTLAAGVTILLNNNCIQFSRPPLSKTHKINKILAYFFDMKPIQRKLTSHISAPFFRMFT